MHFNEYQEKAKSTDIYPPEHYINCHSFGLFSEAGEIAGKLKKINRDDKGKISNEKRVEIAHELGDVQWYIARLAEDLGYDLEDIAIMNIEKLSDRKNRNQIGGSGDHR